MKYTNNGHFIVLALILLPFAVGFLLLHFFSQKIQQATEYLPKTFYSSKQKIYTAKPSTTFFYGVNVEMSQILPDSEKYIRNDKGEDLIDIAHTLGITLFRITNETRSFSSNSNGNYTKKQWDTVLNKMHANGISALILAEYNGSNAHLYSDTLSDDYLTFIKDYLIQSTVADNPDVYGIDLKNEPLLNDNNLSYLQKASKLIKNRYPSIQVTIGSWKITTGAKDDYGKTIYQWNDADNGKTIGAFIDFYSVHLYDFDKKVFGNFPDPFTHTKDFLTPIFTFSNGKPILIEEFGAGNGDAVTDQNTLGSQELQANAFQGVYSAAGNLQSEGVIGTAAFQFISRDAYNDGWAIVKDSGNIIYPAGYVLKQAATGNTDSTLSKPQSFPTDYIFTSRDNGTEVTVHKNDIIALEPSLNVHGEYTMSGDNHGSLMQTDPLHLNASHNMWSSVLHAVQRGITHLSVTSTQPCPNANNCAPKSPEYTITITVL